MAVVRRRQLKRSSLSEAMTKKGRQVFSRKNRMTPISCRPGWYQPQWRHCTLPSYLRVNGCNTVLAASSKATTHRLQRVLNAAARVVHVTHKFDRGLTHLLHCELHWLNVSQRIQFKLGVTVCRCAWVSAGQCSCCKSTTDVASHHAASRYQLIMARHCRSKSRPSRCVTYLEGCYQVRPSGVFLCRLQAWQPGTRCQTISVIRHSAKTL